MKRTNNISLVGILTAFGFTQFAEVMPETHIPKNRQLIVSHMEPFGARLDIEVIKSPHPLNGTRCYGDNYTDGGETTYIHFILNQRTLPLGISFPKCGKRDDGWCELTTFLEILSTKLDESMYDYSCNGKYPAVPYGTLTNGAPLTNAK